MCSGNFDQCNILSLLALIFSGKWLYSIISRMEVKLSEETNNSNDLILKLLTHMADLQKENHELRTENFKVKTEVAVSH